MNFKRFIPEHFFKIPKTIWLLSFSTLLMTMSGAVIFNLMPIYQKQVLGLEVDRIAFYESAVEFIALSFRVISGYLSDLFLQRKPLILAGFSLSSIAKIGLPFSTGVFFIFTFRVFERLGNGIQASPRDALVGDIAPKNLQGASFGLRQGLGKLGSTLGSVLVFTLLIAVNTKDVMTAEGYLLILLVGTGLSFLATIIMWCFVNEPSRKTTSKKDRFTLSNIAHMPTAFWLILVASSIFNASHFNESFLSLRAVAEDLPVNYVPLIMVFMNAVIFTVSYPIGKLSDTLGRFRFLYFGILSVVAADICLAYANHWAWIYAGVLFWGVQMAITQAMILTLISENVPLSLRGTAFGLYNLAMGVVYFIAGVAYGKIWQFVSIKSAFLSSAAVAILSLIVFEVSRKTFFHKNNIR